MKLHSNKFLHFRSFPFSQTGFHGATIRPMAYSDVDRRDVLPHRPCNSVNNITFAPKTTTTTFERLLLTITRIDNNLRVNTAINSIGRNATRTMGACNDIASATTTNIATTRNAPRAILDVFSTAMARYANDWTIMRFVMSLTISA